MSFDPFEGGPLTNTGVPRSSGPSVIALIAKIVGYVVLLLIGVPLALVFVVGFISAFSSSESKSASDIDGNLAAGVAAMQAGDSTKALELFNRVLTEKEASPTQRAIAQFRTAECFWKQNRSQHTIPAAEAALSNNELPADLRARLLAYRAEAFAEHKDFASCLSDVDAVLASEAADHLTKALALRARSLVRSIHGETELSLADGEEAIRFASDYPDLIAQIRFNNGVTLQHSGDLAKAMVEYSAVIESEHAGTDFLARARTNRATLLYGEGKAEQALVDLEFAEQLGKTTIRQVILDNLLILYSENGDLDRQLEISGKLVEQAGDSETLKARALLQRGLILVKAKQADEGQSMLAEARQLATAHNMSELIAEIDAAGN
ncbi:MAG: hypothetical protein JNL58_11385 [Planctomyces sp.]|nr:hypothetical protein [Planctomyces sp.]